MERVETEREGRQVDMALAGGKSGPDGSPCQLAYSGRLPSYPADEAALDFSRRTWTNPSGRHGAVRDAQPPGSQPPAQPPPSPSKQDRLVARLIRRAASLFIYINSRSYKAHLCAVTRPPGSPDPTETIPIANETSTQTRAMPMKRSLLRQQSSGAPRSESVWAPPRSALHLGVAFGIWRRGC